MIELEAPLAWLFVPPERLPAQLPPGPSGVDDLGYLQTIYPHYRLAQLKLLRDQVKGLGWLLTLGDWAERALQPDGDRYQWTAEAQKSRRWVDRLPPDLLLGFHPSSAAADVRHDEPRFLPTQGGPRADLHCHLTGALSEPVIWRALVSGALPFREGSVEHGEPWTTVQPFRWALEAATLRLELAAAVGAGPLARWRRPTLSSDAMNEMGRQALIESLDEVAVRLDPAQDPRNRYADPVAVAIGLPPHGPAGEIWLLRKARALAEESANVPVVPSVKDIPAKLARYAAIRCALRGFLVLQPEGEGLLRFTGRLGQGPRVFGALDQGQEEGHKLAEQAPGAQAERASWIWLGWSVARAQAARGASASELRVDLVDAKPSAIPRARGRLLALLEGFHDGAPDHAVGFVQQLHRGHGANQVAEVAKCAKEVARVSCGEYLLGIDLVGNEPLHPPMPFRGAYAGEGAPVGWSRYLHLGEDFHHPLTALRWLAWALRELNLGPADRLGHVLILSGERDREPTIIQVRTRALDLAWAHGWAPELTADLFASLRERIAPTPLSALRDWISWLNRGVHEASLSPASVVALDPPGSDERLLLRRIRMDLVEELSTRGVVLECCPTSNHRVSGLTASSLPILGRHTKDLRWVLGSDDPGLLATGLGREWGELVEAGIAERSRKRLVSLDSLIASRLRRPANPRDVEISSHSIDDRRLPTASDKSSGERWSDAEAALLGSLHGRNIEPVLMSRHFAAAGFARTPTALRARLRALGRAQTRSDS